MIHLTATTPIWIATQPADCRRGIDGFVALCRDHYRQPPQTGVLFVFRHRAATMIRILAYDGSGYWLLSQRLSRGRFRPWPGGQPSQLQPLDAIRLRQRLVNAVDSSHEPITSCH